MAKKKYLTEGDVVDSLKDLSLTRAQCSQLANYYRLKGDHESEWMFKRALFYTKFWVKQQKEKI